MAIKALIFGVDDLYPQLKPFYENEVQRGNLEIGGYAVFENDKWRIYANQTGGGTVLNFNIAIISSQSHFYSRLKQLENLKVPRPNIIDGRIFQVPNLDFPRLLQENIAYASVTGNKIVDNTHSFYRRIYSETGGQFVLTLGKKSYLAGAIFEGGGIVTVGDFSSISWNINFELRLNNFHNYKSISTFAAEAWDFENAAENLPNLRHCKIEIGNDVWIGRGSILKCTNPARPLIIGDGAVIASDSVVVRNVPPYAIVGGNPARLIKYRFSEDIIEALLRIKWWNWDIDKIYENFKYFNRVEEFVALHDIKD